MQTVPLPLRKLIPDPDQPRKSIPSAELELLVVSIRQQGLLLPLRVRPANENGQHVIVSGHRRHAALLQLGVETAPCIIVSGKLDESTILAEQLAENLHRENLSPIEEAQGVHRYLTLRAIPASQAAQELGIPASRISRTLSLLGLPEEVQTAIHAGIIPKETGYYLSRLPEGDQRNRLITQALSGSLTRESAAKAVQATRSDTEDKPSVNRVICKLTDSRTLTLSGLSVRLETLIDSLEELLKEARKARSQGWDVSTFAKVLRDRLTNGDTP